MSKETAITLSDELHERLQALAKKTGRTPSSFIRQAIEQHIEDLEDICLAEEAKNRLNRGESRTLSPAEFWHGLDD